MSDASRALLDDLSRVLVRDLDAVSREVAAYADDAGPWRTMPGMGNCGGTLVLHLVGNVRHFVGAVLGSTGYVRDRELEFSRRDVPRDELQVQLRLTIVDVRATLAACDPSLLDGQFPVAVRDRHLTTRAFLLHLATHLTYHLGQLDAHRRIVTGDATGIDAVAIAPLIA